MTSRYTMDQISAFLYDALNDEQIGANQIYETIIETVAEHTEYLQLQYDKSQQLFDLLKGTAKPYETKTEEEPEEYDYDDMTAKGYWMNADGFWMPPEKEDKVVKWSLPVEEDVDGEYYINFPEDLLEASKLAPGDNIEWVKMTENSYLLRKVQETSEENQVL